MTPFFDSAPSKREKLFLKDYLQLKDRSGLEKGPEVVFQVGNRWRPKELDTSGRLLQIRKARCGAQWSMSRTSFVPSLSKGTITS